jgi:hypothetical protein
MKTIEHQIKKAVAKDASCFKRKESCKRFEEASAYHESLVKAGVTSRRGYCLKAIGDAPTVKYAINKE